MSRNRQIFFGAVIAFSAVLILLTALLLRMDHHDSGHSGVVRIEQTTQATTEPMDAAKATEQTREQTTQPLEQMTQPSEQAMRPQEETTKPPEGAILPPETATQPSEGDTPPEPPAKVPEQTEPVYQDVRVQTAYCDLFYSGQWEDSIRTERITEGFVETVLFYGTADGKETALFAIYFADATDNSFTVGVYSTADGMTVDISAEIFDLKNDGWTDAGFDKICAMQEQVNYVIGRLKETAQTEPPVKVPEETEPPVKAPEETEPVYQDVRVQTAYCDLFYSGQWANSIRTERITEDFNETVLFYGTAEGKETALFAVYFVDATDDSFPVGTYLTADGLTVDISVALFELQDGGWTDDGFERICTMQEHVGYVLEKLEKTEGFSPVQ